MDSTTYHHAVNSGKLDACTNTTASSPSADPTSSSKPRGNHRHGGRNPGNRSRVSTGRTVPGTSRAGGIEYFGMMILLTSPLWGSHRKKFTAKFRFLLRQLGSLDLVYIDKEKNRLADSLARRAISTAHPSNISTSFAAWDAVTFWSPPPDLMDVLNADKRGDFTTRCVKTVGALPRSTSVHTPSNAMLGTTIG
ncbi:hypothetical protein P3L10_009774 [Capsicum annuum]